jgi:VRR-NUC domain-containing protein
MLVVPRATSRRRPLVAERDFQTTVIAMARALGWRHYHTHDSRHSAAGFPDLVLWRPGRVLFVELKTDAGRLTDAQRATIDSLRDAGARAHVWRPADWATIERELRWHE